MGKKMTAICRIAALLVCSVSVCSALTAQAEEMLFTSNREGGVFQLFRMAQSGSAVQRVTTLPMEATHIDWSTDGNKVVFVSTRQGQPDLYAVDLISGRTSQLTDDKAMESTPAWSPDGQQIVYQSYRDNTPKLYIAKADGTGSRKLTDGTGEESAPAFSPNGRQVAYVVTKGRREAQIHTVDLLSGKSTVIGAQPAVGQENAIRWSPDGSRIAYVIWKDDVTNIYTMRSDGSDKKALTQGKVNNNNDPQWSPDGKQILFLSTRNGSPRQAIYVMNADGGEQHELIGGPEEHFMARWSPDAKNVYFVRITNGAGQIFAAKPDGSDVRKLSDGSGYDVEFVLPVLRRSTSIAAR